MAKDYTKMMGGAPPQGAKPAPMPAPMAGGAPMMGGAPMPAPGMMPPMGAEAEVPQENKMGDKGDRLRESIIQALQEKGVMDKLANEGEIQEVMAQVDQLAEAIVKGDKAAIKDNPVTVLLGGEIPGEQSV